MKHSIRTRFTVVFFVIISLMILSIYMVNTFGLEIFYRNARVGEIKNAYKRIDSVVKEVKSSKTSIVEDKECSNKLVQILEEYSYKYNISIAIMDSVTNLALFSSERDGEVLYRRVQAAILGQQTGENVKALYQDNSNKIVLHQLTNDGMGGASDRIDDLNAPKNSFIESFGYLSDNQTMIIMSTPVSSLKESVNLFNRFFLYISLSTLSLGLIFIYFMTKRITSPILSLADISDKMGKQDFNTKYMGNDKDEIGILGNNMNMMSDNLKVAIEDLRLANEMLKDDIRKKDEIDQMRRDFIANVSHELKTPIALIQGYAEGLNEGLCEDEESRKYYTEVIIDEAVKMNKTVKQLLTLSALESGTQVMEMQKFDIVELINGVISSTSILLNEKNVKIKFNEKNPVWVIGDEFKVEEVVTNFTSNAINHVSTDGEIIISLNKYYNNQYSENRCRVSVFNTGNCIPNEDIEHIWDKFYKVDKSHSRQYGGTGIGLSIVKAVIEAHNCDCGVRNLENGVEFWFELKVSE